MAAIGVLLTLSSHAEVVLFFGGDTSHGESYQDRYVREGGSSILETRRYDAAFELLRPLMADANLVMLNLETPLTHRRESPIEGKPSYLYSDPDRAPGSLQELGVDSVSIANNHALDFGAEGLSDTLAALSSVGIASFGAGVDRTAAEAPFAADLADGDRTVSIRVISCFERRDWYEPFDFYASIDQPGVNPIDLPRLRRQIEGMKQRDPAPFVIVTPHWGENYVWRTDELRRLATEMIDAGADMVIGHGAHRLQEIELIRGKWVFYSIGNFVFNSQGSFARYRSTPFSLPLRISLKQTASGYEVGVRGYPIHGNNLVTDYRPRPVTEDEMREVRRLLVAYDSTGSLTGRAAWGRDELGYCVALGTARDSIELLPASPTGGDLIQPGEGRFVFNSDGGPSLNVWTYRPERFQRDDPVLIVMHGTRRNADEYRNAWIEHAERLGVLLLTPQFTKADYPSGRGYQHLNVADSQGTLLPQCEWAPQRVEALFDHVVQQMELATDSYYLYGHSAGGQFVHRSMFLLPKTRVKLAIAANSGWYTLPRPEAAYPEGLASLALDDGQLDRALDRRVVVLLGTADSDPNHKSLPRGEAAMRQGPHRLARGKGFFAALQRVAKQRGLRLNWRKELAPGVGHSNTLMAPHAAELIAADLAAEEGSNLAPRIDSSTLPR